MSYVGIATFLGDGLNMRSNSVEPNPREVSRLTVAGLGKETK